MELSRAQPELLDHLVVEFGEHGHRAVEFVLTAQRLLEGGLDAAPRAAAMIAYCLREAMKAIPASQDAGDGGSWKHLSREVVSAKTRYELVRGVPGEDWQGSTG